MNGEGSPGAADASAENALSQEEKAESGKLTAETGAGDKQVFGTPVGEILAAMDDLPDDLKRSEAEAAAEEQRTEDGGQQQRSEVGGRRSEAEHRPAADATKTAATGEDHPVPNEWPQDAKARVKEEADKRRTRTVERDNAITRAETAEAKVAELEKRQPVVAAPTPNDPLADVTNQQELVKAKDDYEKLLEWATINADGVEQVQIGLDANKQPVIRDYSKEEMAQIRLTADRMLRNAIPQKHAYLQMRQASEPLAREAHPNLFAPGTPENQEYSLILQQLPEISRFPDYQMWIGDAIAGRNARMNAENGKLKAEEDRKKASPTVAALTAARKPAIAKAPAPVAVRTPAPPVERGRSGGGSGDAITRYEEQAIASGGDDASIEGLVGELLGSRKRDEALV